MRAASFVAPLIIAVTPLFGAAQTTRYYATVTDSEVNLRANPSDKFPITDTLKQGDEVKVDHEEAGGWLAIQPPKNSLSWVPTTFVSVIDETRPLPQNVKVSSEGQVTLAPGKVGVQQPLDNFRKVTVPNGTVLVVIGAKVAYQQRTWYPVQPPDGDFRYLPKTSVKAGQAVSESFTVAGATTTKPNPPANPASPSLAIPAAGTIPSALPATVGSSFKPVSDPLWAQAEQAELAGRLDDAEKLFFELARKMNEPNGDHDIANQCYTRIHNIREKKRLTQAVSGSRAPVPAQTTGTSRTAGTVTSSTGGSDARNAMVPVPAGAHEASPGSSSHWTGPGILIRTGYTLDGRTTYALESSPRVVRYFVVEGPGVDLKKYVFRRVDLQGTATTRRDVPQPLLTATAVEPAQ